MAARLCTALLVLAAVFAMHGVQCTTAAGGAGHAATPAGHVPDAFSTPMTAFAPGHAHALVTAGIAFADPIAAVPFAGHAVSGPATPAGAATAMAAGGNGGVPHDAATHLWTVCLAVLAAALAVLLAVILPRSVQLTAPALGYARARFRSVGPPRPPDLSALCLLRI